VTAGGQSTEEVRREIELERERLVDAVTGLRAQVERVKRRPLKIGLPVIAGAAVAGFVLAGGVRATIRLLAVRERQRRERRSHRFAGLLER
jgi:hypothetical protein